MAHYPLNHHLRQSYRFLAVLAGVYLLITGVVGVAATWGDDFFGRGGHAWSLGLRVNPGGAWLFTLLGLLLVAAAAIGGNVHQRVAIVLGYLLCGLAMVLMATMQTGANVLDASMINVIVLVILGLVAITAGLYGKVGSVRAARAESAAEHPQH